MNESGSASQSPELPRVSSLLVAARTERGLSQKEVADKLFLTTSYIRDIDEGEFSRIKKPAYLKGYLRSYAEVVGIDGGEVIAAYEQTVEVSAPPMDARDVSEDPVGANRFTGPVLTTGLIGLSALILIVLTVWWLSRDDEPRPVRTASSLQAEADADTAVPVKPLQLPGRTAVDDTDADTQGAGAAELVAEGQLATADDRQANEDAVAEPRVFDEAGSEAPDTEGAVLEEPAIEESGVDAAESGNQAQGSDDALPVSGQFADDESAFEPVTINRVRQAQGTVITVDGKGGDKLALTFSGECWVEITDRAGRALYGDLNRDGDNLLVYGDAPFEVLFGKATVVTMTFNEEAVDVSRYTRADETARIMLGGE